MSRWLRKPLSYHDALTLLGADDSAAVALLDRLAGVGVAALNVATVGALSFFELRDEAVQWGNATVTSLRERVKGVSRLDRTERITAAHAVLVITSFFEALDDRTSTRARPVRRLLRQPRPTRGHHREFSDQNRRPRQLAGSHVAVAGAR